MAHSVGKDAFLRQQTAIMGRIDSCPSLSKIDCPTLVLCGREDEITPLEVHREMVEGIVGSKLVVVDKCGHLSTLGQPQQVADALNRWLLDAHE
ncbi:alpha/beta hydrolase [Chitinimonas sp. BJB300]|nr:alpha/beta hydrolase [Chitinimonas sp. BJB300]